MRELGDPVLGSRAAYVVVGVVFVAAVLMVWLGRDELRQAGGQTLTASLLGFLATLMLDVNAKERDRTDKRHEAERARLTQQLEHTFAVGSSSHMANVAFDKHVKFCEDYAEELRRTMEALLDFKRHREAFDQAKTLTSLRQKQALWLTPEMEAPLEEIERRLRWIGGKDFVVSTASEADQEALLDKVHKMFVEVLGEDFFGAAPDGEKLDQDLAIGNVIRGLGKILGVADLATLRHRILRAAATATPGSD